MGRQVARLMLFMMAVAALLASPALGPVAMAAPQVTLGADDNLDGGADLGTAGTVPPDISPTGSGTQADPWLYTFTTGGLDLATYKVYTTNGESLSLDLAGNDLVGSGAMAFDTYRQLYGVADTGSVTVKNVGQVSIGGIRTESRETMGWGSASAKCGAVTIGEAASRAGDIRIDYINAANTLGVGKGGKVTIYGSGDVRIQTSGGVAGSIDAHGGATSSVTIDHFGDFIAASIETWTDRLSYTSGGPVTLNGGGAGGSCVVGTIDTRQKRNNIYGRDAGNVTITGYGSVLVENKLLASTLGLYNWDNTHPDGGDVNINNIAGNIHLRGGATCNGAAEDLVRDGYMSLATTNGGTIIIGDPDDPTAVTFDLHDFAYSLFDSATGESWLLADLENVVEGTTRIQVATPGDVIYYSREANADLLSGGPGGDGIYHIGGGGTLEPEPLAVPEPAGLALVGWALLGASGLGPKRRK